MTAAQTAKKASTTWDDWYGIDADPRRRRVIWGATLLASVLLHLILLKTSSVSWWSPIHPPRMEVQEMDTAALERIKRQWTQEPEQFVLGNSKPSVTAANPTARFASDRNRKVENRYNKL